MMLRPFPLNMRLHRMVEALKKCLCVLFILLFFVLPAGADTVSMSFSNVPVGYLFQNLGKLYGVSFSISSAAAAKVVSVELTDVEFRQALNVIAQSAGVEIVESGKGVYIVRAVGEETEGVSQEEKKRKEQERRLQGAVMESLTTKFVGAKEVQEALNAIFDEDYGSLVSVSQLAGEDEKEINYNSIVIYASSPEILATVKKVVAQIDRPKPMVEMEALFVELTLNDNKDIGANWNVMTNPLKFQEEAPAQNPENDPMKYYTARFGQFWRISPWEAEATISAIQGSGTGRVLANPKVRVMSGRKAAFVSETQMPILTKDSDGEINTEWKNVGISLEMLPIVLDDGTIHIKVTPRASSIVGEKRLGEVSAPIISERRVETDMLLKPDETIVIGGLINDRDIKSMSKVPVLGDIPLFGELFRSTNTEKERSTVIVFLRPRVVEPYSGSNLPEGLSKKYEETVEIKPVSEPVKQDKQVLPVTEKTKEESPEKPEQEKPAGSDEYEKKWLELVKGAKEKQEQEKPKEPEVQKVPEKPAESETKQEKPSETKQEKPKEPEVKQEKPKGPEVQETKEPEKPWVPPLK